MSYRRAFIAIAAVGSIAALYTLSSWSEASIFNSAKESSLRMTSSGLGSDLMVKLEQKSSNPPVLKVLVSNKNSKSALTFLSWDSPFDEQALNVGVFTLKDAETGKEVEGPNLKLNRLLPPPKEALVEVAPQSDVTKELELKAPWIPTDSGKKYTIEAHGAWKHVWSKVAVDVSSKDLEEPDPDLTPFKSDPIEISLS